MNLPRLRYRRPCTLTPAVACLLVGILLSGWLLAACAPQPQISPGDPWLYADLISVEAPSGISPTTDLVAAYARRAGNDLQIRLDLLELDPLANFDFYLALDTGPGGRRDLPFQAESTLAWDTLLYLPHSASPATYQSGEPASPLEADPRLIPRFVRYPWLDTLVVSLNANNLPASQAEFSLQAFLVAPEDGRILDRLGPLRSDALPPVRAPILLAFWNTFPAYTPAQALRRWDGAHTGPYGERHGLHLLLQAVRRTRVPVVLLDLKTPASLSALDYLGRIPQVQNLAAQGLLILPDALPGSPAFPYFPSGLPEWAAKQAARDSRQAGLDIGLRGSPFLYAPRLPENMEPDYPFIFTQLPAARPAAWKGCTLLPVPLPSTGPQMDQGGLSLELKQELLRNAAGSDQTRRPVPPVVLGGSLPDHPLGDPQAAEAVFNYIAAHPWIQPLGPDELQTLRPAAAAAIPSTPGQAPYEGRLSDLPSPAEDPDPLTLAAWQAALALYAPLPPEPGELARLRGLFAGQPGLLLAARRWAENPGPILQCAGDLDQDGKAECLLASPEILAVLDPHGGRLLMLFARTQSGAHQLVAPSSQFIAGLSEPQGWDLQAGEGAELAGLQGAFADGPPPWDTYRVEPIQGGARFTSPDGQVRKTFRLTGAGLRVEYQAGRPLDLKIPIAIDPWQRFRPGWATRYQTKELPDGYAWSLADGARLEVNSTIDLQASSFTDSRPQLNLAEDPNFAYPPGHYLPFPLTVLEGNAQGEFSVDFSVIEE